jgi:hypothetical protein
MAVWWRCAATVCLAVTMQLVGVGTESAVAGDERNDTCATASVSCDTADLPRPNTDRPRYLGTLPTVLYRVDTTPPLVPEGAFEIGLNARGDGISIISHLINGPPMGGANALVGLTASPIVASRLAEDARGAGTATFIYTVHPSENYYNVDQSLNWIGIHGIVAEADRNRLAQARTRTAGLAQWVAFAAILPEEIVEAREVTMPLNRDEDFRDQNPHEVIYKQLAHPQAVGDKASMQLLTY